MHARVEIERLEAPWHSRAGLESRIFIRKYTFSSPSYKKCNLMFEKNPTKSAILEIGS